MIVMDGNCKDNGSKECMYMVIFIAESTWLGQSSDLIMSIIGLFNHIGLLLCNVTKDKDVLRENGSYDTPIVTVAS